MIIYRVGILRNLLNALKNVASEKETLSCDRIVETYMIAKIMNYCEKLIGNKRDRITSDPKVVHAISTGQGKKSTNNVSLLDYSRGVIVARQQ